VKRLLLTLLALAAVAGCAQPQDQDRPTLATTTEAAVVADLRAHGFKVTMRPAEKVDPMWAGTGTLGGRINGVEAVVFTFQQPGEAAKWADISGRLDGVGVVADAWAVSFGPVDVDRQQSAKARAQSISLARKIAAAIGGKVVS
jgi:hypothetical protein